MTLNEKIEALKSDLTRLACLGNGDVFGNSIGNVIAQDALRNLPEPMTEQEISKIIVDALEDAHKNDAYDDAYVIKALKSAGCLLVREE